MSLSAKRTVLYVCVMFGRVLSETMWCKEDQKVRQLFFDFSWASPQPYEWQAESYISPAACRGYVIRGLQADRDTSEVEKILTVT